MNRVQRGLTLFGLRSERKLTAKRVASEVGCNIERLRAIEQGAVEPEASLIERLEGYFGVPRGTLIVTEKSPAPTLSSLRELRELVGLTEYQLARAMNLQYNQINTIEYNPNAETAQRYGKQIRFFLEACLRAGLRTSRSTAGRDMGSQLDFEGQCE